MRSSSGLSHTHKIGARGATHFSRLVVCLDAEGNFNTLAEDCIKGVLWGTHVNLVLALATRGWSGRRPYFWLQ